MAKTKRQQEAARSVVHKNETAIRLHALRLHFPGPYKCEQADHAFEPGMCGVCRRCGGETPKRG